MVYYILDIIISMYILYFVIAYHIYYIIILLYIIVYCIYITILYIIVLLYIIYYILSYPCILYIIYYNSIVYYILLYMFASDPRDLGSITDRFIPKTQKMVLDASLLNTQYYKLRIKGQVEQSRERSSALHYTLVK